MDDRRARLAEIASGQLGLVTAAQMISVGFSRGWITKAVARGELRRVVWGVYAVAGAPFTWEQRVLAHVLAAGEGAMASHWTAARLLGFPNVTTIQVEVTIPRERAVRIAGFRPHRATVLPDLDRTTVGAIPCATWERTLVDLTARWSKWQLGRALDDGIRRGATSLRRLRACTNRQEAGPGRRPAVIYELLDEREGAGKVDSASERRVLETLRLAGLPAPVTQHRLELGAVRYRADFAYPDRGVIIEYLGFVPHSTFSAHVHDRQRANAIRAAGLRLIEWTAGTTRQQMVRDVCTALGRDPAPHLDALTTALEGFVHSA